MSEVPTSELTTRIGVGIILIVVAGLALWSGGFEIGRASCRERV